MVNEALPFTIHGQPASLCYFSIRRDEWYIAHQNGKMALSRDGEWSTNYGFIGNREQVMAIAQSVADPVLSYDQLLAREAMEW